MEKPPKTAPTIHHNGTCRRDLVQNLDSAWNAADNARDAVRLAAPNGRDYYPQGDGAYKAATEQHRWRLTLLDQLQESLKEEMDSIEGQS